MPVIVSEDTIDDLLHGVLSLALESGERIAPTKGAALDLTAVTVELRNPLARVSRSATRGVLFSPLGELCWYLSGSNEIRGIAPYIALYKKLDEGGRAYGGYGPRLFGPKGTPGQLHAIIGALRKNPASRKAVVQIFDWTDLTDPHLDVPCTCTLQFLIRGGRLVLVTYMRSNDAFKGLPHDIFSFTMLQELAARSLGMPIGPYVHIAGSLHLYETDVDKARTFLSEGWQATAFPMPPMPDGDPWPMVGALLEADADLRDGAEPLSLTLPDDPYWADLIRVLMVFFLFKQHRAHDARKVVDALHSDAYRLAATEKTDQIVSD